MLTAWQVWRWVSLALYLSALELTISSGPTKTVKSIWKSGRLCYRTKSRVIWFVCSTSCANCTDLPDRLDPFPPMSWTRSNMSGKAITLQLCRKRNMAKVRRFFHLVEQYLTFAAEFIGRYGPNHTADEVLEVCIFSLSWDTSADCSRSAAQPSHHSWTHARSVARRNVSEHNRIRSLVADRMQS